MKDAADLLRLRLHHQGLSTSRFRAPEEVVSWFGAVQAQDYLGSLWAIGCRLRAATQGVVEEAEQRRAIVRTWPMRGTLHFVAASDVRWMTRLLAPRVMARNAARVRNEFGVDARVLGRSAELLTRALEGGRRLERMELYAVLEAGGIRTGASRGLHILVWLAMQGVLCHAGRQGRQQTFALLDEWVPTSPALTREASLAELARRYFTSHGPATLKDFMWWAALTRKDALQALDHAGPGLTRVMVEGTPYWWRDLGKLRSPRRASVTLLPAFDEYTVAYHDRAWLASTKVSKMSLLNPAVLIEGRVVGTWRRTLTRNALAIETSLTRRLSAQEKTALQDAIRRYGDFLGAEAVAR
jgi:hypothetical protein